MDLQLEMGRKDWLLKEPFGISRGVRTTQAVIQVKLTDRDGHSGWGEASGIDYQGETPETMQRQIEAVAQQIRTGVDRQALLKLLPHGGARFAVDTALWDLEAKQTGISPFDRFGVRADPVKSDQTIGIRDLAGYEAAAVELADFAVIKVKVNRTRPLDAIRAVRRGAPGPRLIVDPNQSWSVSDVKAYSSELAALGVVLLEQPIPVGAEAQLDGFQGPVPLCADELIDDIRDLERARGGFQFVNIKLDKCGGLTAAQALADAAQRQGFQLMVGCMVGSSLSMAPAMVLAQRCAFADLDGPLLQAEDVEHGFVYEHGVVNRPYNPKLWG